MDATAASPSPPLQPPESPLSPTSYLLIDIIVAEILPKLPVKSLIRFKVVCKSFKTLISSPEFARLHLRQSLSSGNRRLLINRDADYFPHSDSTLHSLDLDSLSRVSSATYCWTMCTASVAGSCDGLLLIARYIGIHLTLVLLNPSTRSYVDIHLPAGIICYESLGLGFDHNGNDYKIVAVTCMFSGPSRRLTMVYSVNSKSWNVVDFISPSDHIDSSHGALINNHLLHWMFQSPQSNRSSYRIGCFDVCIVKWKDDLLFPGFFYDPCHSSYHFSRLGVLDGLLYSSFINGEKSCYDVWMMNEYGVHESWVKLLSFNISEHCTLVPLACGEPGSNEVLLWWDSESSLIWYNRKDNTSKEARAPGFWHRQPYICKESLVSFPDAKLFGAVYEPEECAEERRL